MGTSNIPILQVRRQTQRGKCSIAKATELVDGGVRFEVNAQGGIRERPGTSIISMTSPGS